MVVMIGLLIAQGGNQIWLVRFGRPPNFPFCADDFAFLADLALPPLRPICDRYRDISGVNFSSFSNSVDIVIFFSFRRSPGCWFGFVSVPRSRFASAGVKAGCAPAGGVNVYFPGE